MTITVNGERREIDPKTTLEQLINELGIGEKVMAAAVNMEIVKKDQWPRHRLREEDRVELLHFVGGG
jgi:sulfur carrier protein